MVKDESSGIWAVSYAAVAEALPLVLDAKGTLAGSSRLQILHCSRVAHAAAFELLSKLLVSPLITPIIVPYIIPYIFPFKEFRLWLIWQRLFLHCRCFCFTLPQSRAKIGRVQHSLKNSIDAKLSSAQVLRAPQSTISNFQIQPLRP